MNFDCVDPEFERYKNIWYQNPDVLFNIIECLKYHETVFIRMEAPATIRCIKANAIPYLISNFKRYKFIEQPFNMYQSLGMFPNMPMFSFSINERREQQDQFNDNFLDYMKGYDLLLDIDNEDLRLAYSSAVLTKKIFDDYKLPYTCLFSGKKGFHFRIEYNLFPLALKKLTMEALCDLFKDFAYNFAKKHNIPDLDLGIYDLRRIAKTPYSIVYPYYFVALPLSDQQFNNFTFEMVSLPFLLEQNIHRRGLLTRIGDSENMIKLMNDCGVYIE